MRNGEFLKEMGGKIKAARLANKMSLPKLSAQTGVDMSNLWFIENGRRNAHILTLKSIAEILNVDLKELI
jgi:transcriptional regulator with XRE-family HTH domain